MTVTIRLQCAVTSPKHPGLLVNLVVTGDGEVRHWNAAQEVARRMADKRLADLRRTGRRVKNGEIRMQWVVSIDNPEFKGMLCAMEVTGDGSEQHWRDAFSNARHTCGQRTQDTWLCEDNQALRWNGDKGHALAAEIAHEFTKVHRRGHESLVAQPLHVPASGPVQVLTAVRPNLRTMLRPTPPLTR